MSSRPPLPLQVRYLLAGLPPRGDVVSPVMPDDRFTTTLALYRTVVERLPDGTVLDLGCGTGAGAASLSERASAVVGLDSDRRLVRFARRRFGGAAAFRPLEEAGVPSPGAVPEAPFDGVVALAALRQASDVEAAVEQLAALVSDGGSLFSAVAPIGLPEGLESARTADPAGNHFYAWYWQALLESAFERVRLVRVLPPPGTYPDFNLRAPSELDPADFVAEEIEAEALREGPALSLLLVAEGPRGR